MRRSVLVLCVLAAACGGKRGSSSKEVRVAAASDLARALEEVGPAFEKQSGIKVTVTAGSTGLLAKQIEERAPFDLFLAANKKFADDVVAAGACDGSTQALYARGRLVVWSRGDGVPKTLEELADPKYKKIGIGNPDHAPYGTAAKQALIKAGVWDKIKDRVVYGENIQVTMQWAKAGEVDAALVALSLAVVADGGSSVPVDMALHEPLDQAMVVCGTGPGAEAAKKLQAFLGSDEGREIMTRYGFLLPGDTAPEPKGGTGGDRVAAPLPLPVSPPFAVTKVVDLWLRAQNEDDFEDYQRYYADRFTGIKRVGPRSWQFDREGWFADRGKMFSAKAPMKVTTSGTRVVSVGRMSIVTFTQTFQQGKFKDTGPKQLIIVENNGVLRIAREEMLLSTMVEGPGAADAVAYSILDHDAGSWLLVDRGDDAETRGKPEHAGGSDAYEYSTIQELALPSPLVGKTVTTYPGGGTCKIKRVVVLSMLTPHFGTQMEWSGDLDGDGTAEEAGLDQAGVDEAVAHGGSSYLAADIGDCGGDGEVGLIEKTATEWTTPADDTLVTAAQQAFSKLSDYKNIQEEYAADGGQGQWDETEDGSSAADAWVGPNGEAIIVVGATAGAGCGGFWGSLYAVFTSRDGKKVKLHSLISGMPTVAFDVEGDGVPELASAASIYVRDGAEYVEVSTVDYGYHDCPC